MYARVPEADVAHNNNPVPSLSGVRGLSGVFPNVGFNRIQLIMQLYTNGKSLYIKRQRSVC